MTERIAVVEAAPVPCAACPWRRSNHGRRHPDGWYTKANLRRLWRGMRDGEQMTCHPTDPDNPIPTGARPVPATIETRECAGALILVWRELKTFEAITRLPNVANAWTEYRRRRPGGLTRSGMAVHVWRATIGKAPIVGAPGPPMSRRVDLDGDVAAPVDLPWPPPELTIT